MNILDKKVEPKMDEMLLYVDTKAFLTFHQTLCETYTIQPKIEYSCCSKERGWNIKYKKAGKSLCIIYPKQNYFIALVVIGKKEKQAVEQLLSSCCEYIQNLYHQTEEGNGQKWLMIEIHEENTIFSDTLKLIQIRRNTK